MVAQDLEDGVHLQVGVRVDRRAGMWVDRQQGRVDEVARMPGHRKDAARQTSQALAGVQAVGVLVEGLEVGDLCTWCHALALIHISEPTRLGMISYAVFCLKK